MNGLRLLNGNILSAIFCSANIISGQVSGDSARKLSETFGKIMQDRQSISINSSLEGKTLEKMQGIFADKKGDG